MSVACLVHQAGPTGEWGIRGLGQKGQDLGRGVGQAEGTHQHVRACESWGCYVCSCASDLLPLPAPEEQGIYLSVLVCDVNLVFIVCDSLCG